MNKTMHFKERANERTEIRLHLKEDTCNTLFKIISDVIGTSPNSVSLTLYHWKMSQVDDRVG